VVRVRALGKLGVGAASGIAVAEGLVCVVGDDELVLGVHALDAGGGGVRLVRRVRLFDGELPAAPEARKRAKPDLEALALLPDGALLALGSGSTPARRRGAYVPAAALRGDDAGASGVRTLDLAPLHAELARTFAELNVEGAAVTGGLLRLLQRGNGPAGQNGAVDLDLDGVRGAIAAGRPLDGGLVRAVRPVALGALDGVRLGFTDAAPLGGGAVLFAAAAEESPDTYQDGPCAGSILGVLSPAGDVLWTDRIEAECAAAAPLKIEGVHVAWSGDGLALLLVADADDARIPAELLAAELPAGALPPEVLSWRGR
jgi:hypothetical protein